MSPLKTTQRIPEPGLDPRAPDFHGVPDLQRPMRNKTFVVSFPHEASIWDHKSILLKKVWNCCGSCVWRLRVVPDCSLQGPFSVPPQWADRTHVPSLKPKMASLSNSEGIWTGHLSFTDSAGLIKIPGRKSKRKDPDYEMSSSSRYQRKDVFFQLIWPWSSNSPRQSHAYPWAFWNGVISQPLHIWGWKPLLVQKHDIFPQNPLVQGKLNLNKPK